MLFERVTEREKEIQRDRDRPCVGSLLGWQEQLELSQSKAKCPTYVQGPRTWAVFHWFPRPQAARQTGSATAGTQTGVHMEDLCCRWGLSLRSMVGSMEYLLKSGFWHLRVQRARCTFSPKSVCYTLRNRQNLIYGSISMIHFQRVEITDGKFIPSSMFSKNICNNGRDIATDQLNTLTQTGSN